jgi:hypothetical protein
MDESGATNNCPSAGFGVGIGIGRCEGGFMRIKEQLATLVAGAVVLVSISSVSMANPGMQGDSSQQANAAAMNERIQHRLEKLSDRLEIKASQQSVWEEYARSVSMLEDRNWKRPDKDASAASVAHYRADRATVLAKELTAIAEATDKLQKVLTPDQRKIFDEVTRSSMRRNHEWVQRRQGMPAENTAGGK